MATEDRNLEGGTVRQPLEADRQAYGPRAVLLNRGWVLLTIGG
jgi:hypothetical protein